MLEVHISKHSLFRLKITVGCLTSTYPSIHVETPSRSRSVDWCAHIQAFTFLLTKTLSRSRSVVWCVACVCVGGVCVVCVVVCVWCVVKLGTLSLLFSLLPLLFPLRFLSYLSFSLFFFVFFFSCSFSYSCSCSCPFSFSSSFFPSTHSTLLFSSLHANTVQSTDQQTRRPTLRRLNVMWLTVCS